MRKHSHSVFKPQQIPSRFHHTHTCTWYIEVFWPDAAEPMPNYFCYIVIYALRYDPLGAMVVHQSESEVQAYSIKTFLD